MIGRNIFHPVFVAHLSSITHITKVESLEAGSAYRLKRNCITWKTLQPGSYTSEQQLQAVAHPAIYPLQQVTDLRRCHY